MRSKTSRYSEYLPVALLVAGFVLMGLGWNGAASVDYAQGQIPYMISGGLVGLGLVLYGSAALIVQTVKRGQARQVEELEALSKATQRMVSMLTFTLSDGMSANGHSRSDRAELQLVIAGSASFHLPACRLVSRREGAARIPRDEAESAGLEPCRVCNP